MTQLSNRMTDKNLIELAKQQHENKQLSKYPGLIVNLPSYGKIYPESSVLRPGQLEMRYMTAYDEDILTNPSYIKEGILFDKLIESLVITPGFDINEIADADKEQLVISARIAGYGPKYTVTVQTPIGTTITDTVNLSELKPKPFELEPDENGEFDYIVNDKVKLKFRFPSSNVLKNIPNERAVSYLLEHVITQVNDIREPNQIAEFIRFELRAPDSRKFREYLRNNTPGLDTTYEFVYQNNEGKKETFRAGFPISSDFFWI